MLSAENASCPLHSGFLRVDVGALAPQSSLGHAQDQQVRYHEVPHHVEPGVFIRRSASCSSNRTHVLARTPTLHPGSRLGALQGPGVLGWRRDLSAQPRYPGLVLGVFGEFARKLKDHVLLVDGVHSFSESYCQSTKRLAGGCCPESAASHAPSMDLTSGGRPSLTLVALCQARRLCVSVATGADKVPSVRRNIFFASAVGRWLMTFQRPVSVVKLADSVHCCPRLYP